VTLAPGDSPGFLLWRATLRWQRLIAAALSTMDLTHVQFVLLACAWWLNQHGEEPNQLAVARQAGTDVKMTSQVLRTLEDKGLIERHTDAGQAGAGDGARGRAGPAGDRRRGAGRRRVLRGGAGRRGAGYAPAARRPAVASTALMSRSRPNEK
jgi:MarR family protein